MLAHFLTCGTPRTSPVNSKGPNGAAEGAVLSVEGMARTRASRFAFSKEEMLQ